MLPFNPFTGGMEELTLDQIKKKSDLEEDIDFENGDFSIWFVVLHNNSNTAAVISYLLCLSLSPHRFT